MLAEDGILAELSESSIFDWNSGGIVILHVCGWGVVWGDF